MKYILAIIWILIGTEWSCHALWSPAIEVAPELADALKCEIHLATNIFIVGSNVPIVLTISNNANIEAQLPSPASLDQTINFRLFMFHNTETTGVHQLTIPITFFEGLPTADDRKICEKGPVSYHFLSPRWIVVPPLGKVEIYGCINVFTPLFGTNHLHCVIVSSPNLQRSPAVYITNEWANAEASNPENIAKAKAEGRFLLDLKRLWVGKMQSNIADITVIKSPNQ